MNWITSMVIFTLFGAIRNSSAKSWKITSFTHYSIPDLQEKYDSAKSWECDFYCYIPNSQEMSTRNSCEGIIQDVVLIGAPCSGNLQDWSKFTKVVAGRIVNGYSRWEMRWYLMHSAFLLWWKWLWFFILTYLGSHDIKCQESEQCYLQNM